MERSTERWGDDPHVFDGLAELRFRAADPDARTAIRREQVARWRHAADQGNALLRVVFLEKALEAARTHGLAEEANDLRRELQEISPDDLDLKAVSASVKLPTEEVREVVDSLVGTVGWSESFRALGSEGPPGGTTDEISHEIEREAEEFGITQLFTKTVMGHGTAASRLRAASPQARRELDRAERRAFHASFWAHLYADVLNEIPSRHGRPSREELTSFFGTELIGSQRGERIARAVELFWDGEYDESAHVLAPRLESALRDMSALKPWFS